MSFELPPLPFKKNALEPHMSERTFDFHYDKHHATYVSKLNDAVKETPFSDKSLEEIVRETAGDAARKGIFNNAAQTWNHTFFWNSLSPEGGGQPSGEIGAAIDRDFGSFDKFVEQFTAKAAGQFGSGWGWLVARDGKLDIVTTPNAETPLHMDGVTPLLTVDVWEHAYYLDYQNRRPDFLSAFLDDMANWAFAEENMKNAGVRAAA